MLNFKIIGFNFLLILILFSCKSQIGNKEKEITLFAAAGTTLPVVEICDSFQLKTGIKLNLNFASSGTLARQIASGADADIFISANNDWMQFLKGKEILLDSTYTVLAKNKLVVISANENEKFNIDFHQDFDILSTIPNKIAIGDPAYVPVGKYAKQVFDSLGWTNQLAEKTLLAKDVISVLNYVELGECDWGIVYYSNALHSEKTQIIAEIPAFLYSPVVFYISRLKNSDENAKKLYAYFLSYEAQMIFKKHGFIDLPHD